jgi:aryl-alcohol dehydrogenase-like predicted oxidoreductase
VLQTGFDQRQTVCQIGSLTPHTLEKSVMADAVLNRRRLGRTGLVVTPLGLGGVWLGHTPGGFKKDVAVGTVLRALELGINLIDTSPSGWYAGGESEHWVGLALQEWYRRGGRRDEIILSTKVGSRGYPVQPKDYSAAATRQSLEKSLELLGTGYLDVVLVHDPDDLEPVLARDGALGVLKEFKKKGVIRAIGLGARPHEFHRHCIESGDFDVVLTYRDYNLLDQSAAQGVLKHAAAHDVGVFNATVTIKGLLGGRDPVEVTREQAAAGLGPTGPYVCNPAEVRRAHAMWAWAQSRGINLLALNLQFCLCNPHIASILMGAATPAEIEADVAAISAPIPEAMWLAFERQFGFGP